ncbi:hypothetical protein MLD38_040352 [Melastoma candidum]|uniref:Uncharacterized protein n=1 Tax=Melastoma candidum TaxID=119954 RepID=A0ACB9L5P4_9MYRT|nr:hypothetical protein MLD38_040352 [Melastoma candidum]
MDRTRLPRTKGGGSGQWLWTGPAHFTATEKHARCPSPSSMAAITEALRARVRAVQTQRTLPPHSLGVGLGHPAELGGTLGSGFFRLSLRGLEAGALYEEYIDLTEMPHRTGILPLPQFDNPKEYIAKLLQISSTSVLGLFNSQGDNNINGIIDLQMLPYNPRMVEGQGSARAFILLFVGIVLYPQNEKTINKRAVYITKAILEGAPFLPNLIGETNFSLTNIMREAKQGVRNHRMTFCPALLQLGLTPRTRSSPQQLFKPISLDDRVVKTALQRVIAHISRIWMTLTEKVYELPPEPEEDDRSAQSQRFWR